MSGFPAELNRNFYAFIECEKPIEKPTSPESSDDNMKVTTLEFWIHEMDGINVLFYRMRFNVFYQIRICPMPKVFRSILKMVKVNSLYVWVRIIIFYLTSGWRGGSIDPMSPFRIVHFFNGFSLHCINCT